MAEEFAEEGGAPEVPAPPTGNETADQLREMMRKFDAVTSHLQRTQEELSELRQWQQGVTSSLGGHRSAGQDADAEFYKAPTQRLREYGEQLAGEIMRRVEERDTQREFWSTFEDQYPDLRGKRWVVSAVLQEDAELRAMPVSTGREELAQRTRARLLRLAQEVQGSRGASGGMTVLPGGAGVRESRPAQEEPPPVQSISERLAKLHGRGRA